MKNILFIIALFSMAITSCSDDFFGQTVEIDPPPYTKQLSFHLYFTDQDSSVRLLMTRNYGILETVSGYEDYFVHGGNAELFKDGLKWVTLQPLGPDSTFILVADLPEPLQSGSTYEIRAVHPDYPGVHATQLMPGDFTVDSVRLKRNAVSGEFGDKYDVVDVFLKDQPGVQNYYEVIIKSTYFNIVFDPTTGNLDTLGTIEQVVYPEDFSDPNVVFGFNGSGLLSDQFFDGQPYKFQTQIYGTYGAELEVSVRNISEDYYRWSRSYQAKNEAEDNPLVEPVSVFNNLNNGLGIFSVAREQVFEVH